MLYYFVPLLAFAALSVSAEQSRADFVKEHVEDMWNNKDLVGSRVDIAICYHGDYTVSRPKQVVWSSNPTYHKNCPWYKPWACTDKQFNCFYIYGPNQVFTAESDGNDENLGFDDGKRGNCIFDAGWKTITC